MAEIRDFLTPMTIPELGTVGFADNFHAFCSAIRDNINKIVSAPFLKGDRGSKFSIIYEPLKIESGTPGVYVWSKFAETLIEAIYKQPGVAGEPPLPLINDENITEDNPDGARLVNEDDPEWTDMVLIDGGSVTAAELGYEYEIFKSDQVTSVCTGNMKVISKMETETIIKIITSDDPYWEGKEYVISMIENDFDPDTFYPMSESSGSTLTPLDEYIKIGSAVSLNEEPLHYYHSFDIFNSNYNEDNNDVKYIPVGYDEATGKKFLCIPFYFFDGRLNYVGYLSKNLSLFHDMSCVVFGEASFVGVGAGTIKENLENPDSWRWEMNISNALPKLYYDIYINQFCWEVAGEKTGITAQGIKGDKGDSAKIWSCTGVIDSSSEPKIKITGMINQNDGNIIDIRPGDLAWVTYVDINPNPSDPSESAPYYRIQFGTVHVSSTDVYIRYDSNSEIIHRLRSYSLHDYLTSIGQDPNPDPNAGSSGDVISSLYTIERDNSGIVMAMWAGNSSNHYIAPINISKTRTVSDTEKNPVSGRILNVLYDIVDFKKKIRVNDIDADKGLNISSISTLQDISQNLRGYRLGVLCNVVNVRKKNNLSRIGTILTAPGQVVSGSAFTSMSSNRPYLYMECDLVIGWIPSDIADIFGLGLNSNLNNPALEIYRAQKYHIYVRIPANGSNGTSGISFNGKTWGSTISLDGNLCHYGSGTGAGKTFIISIDSGIVFDECVKQMDLEYITNWDPTHFPVNITGYNFGLSGLSFYYETLTTKEDMVKYPIDYTKTSDKINFYTEQYKLSGGNLKIRSGQSYFVDNLMWFGSKSFTGLNPEQSLYLEYPLINSGFSFLSYFKTDAGNYLTTTNEEGNYMWQGRTISTLPKWSSNLNSSNNKEQNLYYINTSFYETIYPKDTAVFVTKNRDNSPYDTNSHISGAPINSEVHIYPEGMVGLLYEQVSITNSVPDVWNPNIVPHSDIYVEPYAPPYAHVNTLDPSDYGNISTDDF